MKVRDIMTRDVRVIRPDATIQDAAKIMKDLDVGPVPVCDGERLVGMVTDRDITIRATAEGKDPTATRVSEVMTPDVVYCYEDQDVHEAARAMEDHQMRRLIVLDREKRLVGIMSLGDLAEESRDEELEAEVLEAVSYPSRPER